MERVCNKFFMNKEKLKKQLKALKKNKCWVHGDDLFVSITEPFVGYPTEEIMHVDNKYPYHALYSHVGCMPLASGKSQGQRSGHLSKPKIIFGRAKTPISIFVPPTPKWGTLTRRN